MTFLLPTAEDNHACDTPVLLALARPFLPVEYVFVVIDASYAGDIRLTPTPVVMNKSLPSVPMYIREISAGWIASTSPSDDLRVLDSNLSASDHHSVTAFDLYQYL